MALEAPRIEEDTELASLYRDHSRRLRALIRRQVPAHLVDDTLHDTFIRAQSSWARFDRDRPVFPYLATLAYRACHETLRRERRHVWDPPVVDADARADPHEEWENAQRAESVRRAWMGLQPRQRRLLYRRHVDGEHYATLSHEEGVGVEALRVAVHRACRAFEARYRALSEETGIFGALAVSFARLRHRVHRAGTWAASGQWVDLPLATVSALAAFTLAVMSLATAVRPAILQTQEAAAARALAMPIPQLVIPAPTSSLRGPQAVPSLPPTRDDVVIRRGDAVARADTGVGLGVGPDAQEAVFWIVIDQPLSDSSHRTEIPVYCNRGTVSTALCTIGGVMPTAD